MNLFSRRSVLLVLSGIAVCGSVGLLVAAVVKADPPGSFDLSHVVRQFRLLDSLRFSATVELVQSRPADPGDTLPVDDCAGPVERPAGPLGVVGGHYECFASGDRYRVDSYLDPSKMPGMSTQVAFDGQSFQLLLPNGTLSLGRQDSRLILPILTNPLLELVQFRYPLTDENQQYQLRLKDFRQDSDPPGFFDVPWTSVNEDGRTLDRAVFPGGTFEGQHYVHHVYAPPGAHHLPIRIDRVAEEFRVTSTEFSDYLQLESASGPVFLPRSVIMRAFDPAGEELLRISFTITQVQVDSAMNPEAFLIDRSIARKIWDDEARTFLAVSEN